jgi:hypothetical protein
MVFAAVLLAFPVLATEVREEVEQREVGLDDPFVVSVVVSDAPEGASLELPKSPDLELLGKSESSQTSFELINGRASMRRSHTYALSFRATRAGKVEVPPTVVRSPDGKVAKSEGVTLTVRAGHVAQRPSRRSQDPFGMFGQNPFAGAQRQLDADEEAGNVPIPGRDSDLFIRASVDHDDVYVGEQVTLTLYLYSRVDLTQVDPVSMPKLDGFWSEDLDSPTTLAAETKTLNGVPYRAYLLKKRALFPMKPGTFTIDAAEADITTGIFFASRRVHRASNPITIKSRPLPPGAPPGFSEANVGRWKLTVETNPTQVELGNPVTVRVTTEGQGNVRDLSVPKLSGPSALHVYDPTSSDKVGISRGKVTGKRTQEYLVVASQTGTFTLPGLTLPYFDPESKRYDVTRSDPVTLTVKPGAGGTLNAGSASPPSPGPRNILTAGGPHPLRYQASFVAPRRPLWQRGYFLPAVLVAPSVWLALGLLGFARGRLSREDDLTRSRKKARAAKGRLAQAERLKDKGNPAAFYAEVENALLGFLEAKLSSPVAGLTREGLDEKLSAYGTPPEVRKKVRGVLDLCDLGRFAPGTKEGPRAEALLDAADSIMEGFEE